MRDAAVVAVMLALLVTPDQTAWAQSRRVGPPQRFGPGAPRINASIIGHVMTPGSNTPVRAADVVATNAVGAQVSTKTDENGAYRLERLSAGNWRLTASKGGYVTWQFGQRRPFQQAQPISLTQGQTFTADILLTRGGAISGRVYDSSGDSLGGLHVRVYRATIEQGMRRLKAVGLADLTDDTGAFRVYGLPPGDYYVAASLRVAPIDSVVETTYAPTYFPGTSDLSEAQRIRLGLGAEATATFQLLSLRTTRISGTVLNSAGAPANAFLNLVPQGSEFGIPTGAGGVTRSDGTFTLNDVAPGRYVLKATLRGERPDESAAVPLTVDGNELSGIALMTGRPAALRGTIVADAGVTRTLPDKLSVIAFSARESSTVLDRGDGLTFEINSLSEPFRLAVDGLPEGWAVKQILVSDVDMVDDAIELAPGLQGFARIVLTDRLTDVSGTVTPIDQTGARSVVVFPENSAKWIPRSRYVRRVEADPNGTFRVRGLPPGEQYLAFATDYLEDGEHLDAEFLTEIRNLAVPFALDDANKQRLELKVVER
jgi:Carboxypeptidase regulatory-like domain